MEALHIRAATNADTAKVKEFVAARLAEFGLEPDPRTSEADIEDIEATYTRSGGVFALLEESQGRLVGTVAIVPIDAETFKLRKLYLLPALRGRSLGRRLVRHALDFASQAGARRVVLETISFMKDALRLYKSAGFTLVPGTPVSPRCDQIHELILEQRRQSNG